MNIVKITKYSNIGKSDTGSSQIENLTKIDCEYFFKNKKKSRGLSVLFFFALFLKITVNFALICKNTSLR